MSALQSTWWVLSVHALKVGVAGTGHTSLGHRLGVSATQIPAWIFQTIAAFPLRDQPTHTAVYACYLPVFGIVLTLGLRAASPRLRVVIVLLVAAVLLFPYVTTVRSYDQYSAAWQGRYGLPAAMGIVLLAAYALDRRARDLRGPMRMVLFLLFVVAQTVAPAYTLMVEVRDSPQVDSSAWVQPSMLLTIVLAGASSALMWWGAFGRDLPSRDRVRAPA